MKHARTRCSKRLQLIVLLAIVWFIGSDAATCLIKKCFYVFFSAASFSLVEEHAPTQLEYLPNEDKTTKVIETSTCAWQFFSLFGILEWPFQRLSGLQLEDNKGKLNHLVHPFSRYWNGTNSSRRGIIACWILQIVDLPDRSWKTW